MCYSGLSVIRALWCSAFVAITILLAMTVYQIIVSDNLPQTPDIPLISE